MRLVNHVDAPLSLHWAGVRLANAMDGVVGLTQSPVAPGHGFDYRFTPPDSGTFLYRAVVPGRPLGPLADGLHGMLIVDEPDRSEIEEEFLVVAGAFRLDAAGRLVEADGAGRTVLSTSFRGETTMGTYRRGARVRLRYANASQATLMLVSVEPAASVSVIAIDSQPCEPFTPARGVIPIGPGARFDVLIELPRQAGAATRVSVRDALDRADRGQLVLDLRTGDAKAPGDQGPAALPRNPRLPEAIALERAARADLVFRPPPSGSPPRQAAGRSTRTPRVALTPALHADRPALSVNVGTPISFGLVNPSDRPISVHVHGHAMRVLHDLDDGWHPYWRDTVLVEPGKTHHVAFLADNPGRWLVSAQALGASGPASRGWAWYEVRP